MVGSDAVPAGGVDADHALGRPGGSAQGPLRVLAGSLLTVPRSARTRCVPGWKPKARPLSRTNTAMERRPARASSHEAPAARRIQDDAPTGAPSPFGFGRRGREEDRPSRAANNRGDFARLHPSARPRTRVRLRRPEHRLQRGPRSNKDGRRFCKAWVPAFAGTNGACGSASHHCSGVSPLLPDFASSISVTATKISARDLRSLASSNACFSALP
jgi:hypothetical protein